ncbi:MAG: MFS transporter [Rhodospirillaceae bacterium]
MTDCSARLSIGFSLIGHTLMHVLSALYLTVILVLVPAWHLGYDELLKAWTLGSLMIGLGAPLAGWLGDQWSDARMMALFFAITGLGAIAAGCVNEPTSLTVALAVLGLGASIYHPVGMSWLVKNAADTGAALGLQGLYGSLGVACAALIAGTLTELINWRAAFIVPGAICVATGAALAGCIATGLVRDRHIRIDEKPPLQPSRSDVIRAFLVLSLTMAAGGMMWNSLMVAMPKWLDDRLGTLVGDNMLGIGGLVTVIYLAGALPQIWGGRLADRLQPKVIYAACLLLQVPVMLLASFPAVAPTSPLVPVLLLTVMLAVMMVSCQNIQIPIENLLLARFTPSKYRGLAYGAKFVLTFGVGPLAVQLVAYSYHWSGNLNGLFQTLAALALIAFLAALMLPAEREEREEQESH